MKILTKSYTQGDDGNNIVLKIQKLSFTQSSFYSINPTHNI